MKKLLISSLLIFLVLSFLAGDHLLNAVSINRFVYRFIVHLFFVLSLISCTCAYAHFVVKSISEKSKRDNVIMLSMFFVTIFMFELVFIVIPRSHGRGHALSAQVWNLYYYRPNALGYRDVELDEKDVGDKQKLFFLGDSFTEGQGVETGERFSDLFRDTNYVTYNLGRRGAHTEKEFNNLKQYPVDPDVIILQYFGNDIDKLAAKMGVELPKYTSYVDLPNVVSPFIMNSYLLNYFYWLLPRTDVKGYMDFLVDSYKSEEIFEAHVEGVMDIVEYARENEIKIGVLMFPFLQDIELSKSLYLDKLSEVFDDNDVEYIDVSDIITDIEVSDRVVNYNDGHPSEIVHERVASELPKLIENIEK